VLLAVISACSHSRDVLPDGTEINATASQGGWVCGTAGRNSILRICFDSCRLFLPLVKSLELEESILLMCWNSTVEIQISAIDSER
jgi:hypothetical protein